MAAATPDSFTKLEATLLNTSGDVPLHARFRSLFTLKALPGQRSIDIISEGFKDDSALLKHELAYVLGQMGDPYAIPTLSNVLSNESEDPMVRHEAAEALGALSAESAIPLLEKYLTCPERAVRETCEIALDKIKWDATPEGKAANQIAKEKKQQGTAQFTSVDPAPAATHSKLVSSRSAESRDPSTVQELRDLLLDTSKPLFERYRAMFALRDIGTAEAVDALAAGLTDSSALFKHEVAFVFGQLLSPHSVPALVKTLEDPNEDEMVRHEAAEALGGIATPEVLPVLREWAAKLDAPRVVRESCIVALDMYEYENSGEVQSEEFGLCEMGTSDGIDVRFLQPDQGRSGFEALNRVQVALAPCHRLSSPLLDTELTGDHIHCTLSLATTFVPLVGILPIMGVSRKYVDLIHKASGKYGNWDPPHTVEVGDWGTIDRETGKFVREGNIFKDPECLALLSDTPGNTQPIRVGNAEDDIRVIIHAQPEFQGDLHTDIGATGALGVRVNGAWKFTSKHRAAILTMADACSYYLEVGIIFPKLKKVPRLNGRAVVTEALYCPAYALLLTEKGQSGKASLTLQTGIPQTGVESGTGAGMGWKYSTSSGFWRTACGYGTGIDGENAVYTPLYRLQSVVRGWRSRYRGAPASGSTSEEPVTEDYLPPWEDLDEDGEEVPESPTSPEF